MTTPAVTIKVSDIELELGITASTQLNFNDSRVRTLAGVTTAGSTISMSNLRSKSSFTVGSATTNHPITALAGTTFADAQVNPDICTVNVYFTSSGTWYNFFGASGNWGSPTTVGIGNNYWIRFTPTSIDKTPVNSTMNPTSTTGWLALSSNRYIEVTAGSGSGHSKVTWTIEIASNSSGTNIVSTTTGLILQADTSS